MNRTFLIRLPYILPKKNKAAWRERKGRKPKDRRKQRTIFQTRVLLFPILVFYRRARS